MLHTFENEAALLRQRMLRAVTFFRDIVITGVVCLVASTLLTFLASEVDIPLCFVVGSSTPQALNLLLVPASVSVVLGVIVVLQPTRAPGDCEGLEAQEADPFDRAMHVGPEVAEVAPNSGWTRLVIATNVAVLTWSMTLLAVAMAGLQRRCDVVVNRMYRF
ncbi:hypothetical protein NP493_229g03063 [Ridgeia piscesae]|uniref:Uncharacterized protein n=1 Tax=Ridgeia piscesae TaxID=27915 RepID=A0AAD9P0B6_RIDPI|nr:hypothetical protein NP493_229g03063 [Ridgeia piscesae]